MTSFSAQHITAMECNEMNVQCVNINMVIQTTLGNLVEVIGQVT